MNRSVQSMRYLFLILSIFIFVGCRGNSDSALSEKLVGEWSEDITVNDPSGVEVNIKALTTYTSNGMLLVTAEIITQGRTNPFVFRGTWEIKDNSLYTTVTSSSVQEFMSENTSAVDQIVEITDTTFVYINEQGERFEASRE